nr:EOG090X0LJK [Triops cancriformis]
MKDTLAGEEIQNANNKAKPKTAARPKPVYLWTTQDVQKWFRRHCSDYYNLYSEYFLQHGICGRALVRMNDLSLERMGIKNYEHREEIWRQITKLRLKTDILEMRDMEKRSGIPWE